MLVPTLRFGSGLVAFAVVLACSNSNPSSDSTGGTAGTGSVGASGGSSGSGGTYVATGGSGTQMPCDPLAPKDTSLGDVIGVGKDTDGTLYVDSSTGIFVSSSGKMIRQHVIGEGQSGENEFLFMFVPPGADDTVSRNLLVETTAGKATAMALGPSDSKTFINESDAGLTMLTVVDAAAVSGMPIVNTPNEIQYIADVANGYVLLATRPMNQDYTSTTGGLAIFYGPPGAVAERPVTNFEQSMSNNGTVTFLVDGVPYVLAFGMVSAPDAGPFGAFTLFSLTPQAGAPLNVTLRSPTPTVLPAGLSFTCLM